MSIPETSVIIPNWNGRDLLDTCLSSLRRQTYRNFEIIVIDNGSSDDSIQFIESFYPEVRVVKLQENKGFCVAVNCGIKLAWGKYVALLNNDTETHPEWLRELVKALEENPGVGFCASKMVNFFERNKIDNAGDKLSFYGSIVGKNEIDSGQYDQPRFLFSACAGAAIYRREMFEDIGLFDEDFFAYYEDIDLGMRAQLRGYKCLFVPTALVYHIHQATSDRMPTKRFIYAQRNIIFVHLKNMPLVMLLKILPAFLTTHILVSFGYLIHTKDIKTVLSIYWQVFRKIPSVLIKRRHIQKKIRVPVSYIESITGPFPSLTSLAIKHYKKKYRPEAV